MKATPFRWMTLKPSSVAAFAVSLETLRPAITFTMEQLENLPSLALSSYLFSWFLLHPRGKHVAYRPSAFSSDFYPESFMKGRERRQRGQQGETRGRK